jgi:hypothetical protein
VSARNFYKRGQSAPNVERIIGVGSAKRVEQLWETLRGYILRERRRMKNQFV